MDREENWDEMRSEYKNTAFDILNSESNICSLHKLNAPFQITYEYCSGSGPDEYLNILSMSENGCSFNQESIELHNYLFHHKAPHYHNHYEFFIVLEGSLSQHIEGKDYLYPEGYACLLNRNLYHKETFNRATKVLFMGFSEDFIINLLNAEHAAYFTEEMQIRNTYLYSFITDDLNNPGRKAYLDFIPTLHNAMPLGNLHQFADTLINHMMFPQFGSTYMVKGLLCNILKHIADPHMYHCTCAELDSSSDYLLFSRVEHLLEENDGRISRAELSSKLNYSSDYLNRIMNKYTGMCLHDYGMKFCMKKAAHYLSSTDESISAIMARLSFSNRTYFYKLFKEQYGVTPKEYRKNRANAASA